MRLEALIILCIERAPAPIRFSVCVTDEPACCRCSFRRGSARRGRQRAPYSRRGRRLIRRGSARGSARLAARRRGGGAGRLAQRRAVANFYNPSSSVNGMSGRTAPSRAVQRTAQSLPHTSIIK